LGTYSYWVLTPIGYLLRLGNYKLLISLYIYM